MVVARDVWGGRGDLRREVEPCPDPRREGQAGSKETALSSEGGRLERPLSNATALQRKSLQKTPPLSNARWLPKNRAFFQKRDTSRTAGALQRNPGVPWKALPLQGNGRFPRNGPPSPAAFEGGRRPPAGSKESASFAEGPGGREDETGHDKGTKRVRHWHEHGHERGRNDDEMGTKLARHGHDMGTEWARNAHGVRQAGTKTAGCERP